MSKGLQVENSLLRIRNLKGISYLLDSNAIHSSRRLILSTFAKETAISSLTDCISCISQLLHDIDKGSNF